MANKIDAFISYTRSSPDLDCAITLERALATAGLRVWRDNSQIVGGDHFFEEIVLALQESRAVVAIISKTSLERPWVLGEIFTARSFDKLIPVVIGDGDARPVLPFGISETTQCLQADDVESVIEGVRKQRRRPLHWTFLRRFRGPEHHAPLEVLNQLAFWPSRTEDALKLRARMEAARRHLSQSSRLRAAYDKTCDARQLGIGLAELHSQLRVRGTPQQWLSLCDLALPFDQNIALAALQRSGASAEEVVSRTGADFRSLIAERIAEPEMPAPIAQSVTPAQHAYPPSSGTLTKLSINKGQLRKERDFRSIAKLLMWIFVIGMCVLAGGL